MTDFRSKMIKLTIIVMVASLTCGVAQAQETDSRSANKKSGNSPKTELVLNGKSLEQTAPTNLVESFKTNWANSRSRKPSGTAMTRAGNAGPQPASSDEWEFQVTPYLWMTAMNGTLGAGGRTADVDVSFSEIFDNLNFALMGAFEAKKGKLLIPTDMMYVNLGDEAGTPGPLFSAVSTDTKMYVLEPKIGYRAIDNKDGTFDIIGGVRYWHLRTTLDFSAGILPATRVSESQNWVDPIVGARGTATLSPKSFLFGKADIGGFGAASDFTWQALGGLGYRFNDRYALMVGYRYLSVDYRNNTFIYDVNMHGLITGLNIRFK